MLNTYIESKTMTRSAFVLAVIGVAVSMGHLIYSRLGTQEVRAGGSIPYTVILRETLHFPDGTSRVGIDMTQAVRSDGSVVMRSADSTLKQRIIHLASGIEVVMDEVADAKSTMFKQNVDPARWQRDPSSKCINSLTGESFTSAPEVFSGEEMVAGHRTVKLTRKNATRWFAVDCGCAMVKARYDWDGGCVSEKSLVALIPGEPKAALFEVPATAKEVPPSEFVSSSGKNRKDAGPKAAEQLRKADEHYYAHRPPQ